MSNSTKFRLAVYVGAYIYAAYLFYSAFETMLYKIGVVALVAVLAFFSMRSFIRNEKKNNDEN